MATPILRLHQSHNCYYYVHPPVSRDPAAQQKSAVSTTDWLSSRGLAGDRPVISDFSLLKSVLQLFPTHDHPAIHTWDAPQGGGEVVVGVCQTAGRKHYNHDTDEAQPAVGRLHRDNHGRSRRGWHRVQEASPYTQVCEKRAVNSIAVRVKTGIRHRTEGRGCRPSEITAVCMLNTTLVYNRAGVVLFIEPK